MITPAQAVNPKVKPKWQLPVGVMEGIVAHNCKVHGFPRPVLAMPIWEGAGARVYDYSGHGNHGNFVTHPEWRGEGLKFTGGTTGDRIVIKSPAGSSLDITGEHVTCFTHLQTQDNTTDSAIIVKAPSGNLERYMLGMDGTQDKVRFRIYTGSYDQVYDPTVLPLGEWHGMTGTYDGANMKIYRDGELRNTKANTGSMTSNAGDVLIGKRVGTERYFTGEMSIIYVWDVTLSAEQIKFISDDPYFMFRIPEVFLGGAAGAAPSAAIINMFLRASLGADLFNGVLQ
jgi:hypothetical protein